jgi:hypothetical protein
MNRFALTALVVLAGAASQSLAQFSISWFTIDGGGGTSTGGNFTLSGTIGQPDAGAPLTGGNFSLTGGFWAGITPSGCDDIDFNNNSVFPEDADVIDFFNVLAGADCPACNDIDFNNNSVFPEDQDVIDFFNVLAGGECPA